MVLGRVFRKFSRGGERRYPPKGGGSTPPGGHGEEPVFLRLSGLKLRLFGRGGVGVKRILEMKPGHAKSMPKHLSLLRGIGRAPLGGPRGEGGGRRQKKRVGKGVWKERRSICNLEVPKTWARGSLKGGKGEVQILRSYLKLWMREKCVSSRKKKRGEKRKTTKKKNPHQTKK